MGRRPSSASFTKAGSYRSSSAVSASPGLYSVRSEQLLMEQLHYNLLFRWLVGLSMDDPIWDVTAFSKNRDRLLEGGHRQGRL